MSATASPPCTQAGRPLKVLLPGSFGPDDLLLASFAGSEGFSRLFRYQLDLLAEHQVKGRNPTPKAIEFANLLGQSITVELNLPGGLQRYFNGICSRVSQGAMDAEFTEYHLELVPRLWLLTRKTGCRTFQHVSVKDILTKVLKDDWKLAVEGLDALTGPWHPRDFCVQYRETDFNFVCRLMEEEGIAYYFKHENGSHTLVLANATSGYLDMPHQAAISFENGAAGSRNEGIIHAWTKAQELRSGNYTLADYCFEMPDKRLETSRMTLGQIKVGTVTHDLNKVNSDLEIYDWPGEYAQRFDGVDRNGGDRSADLSKIFEDYKRTVRIRMEEEDVAALSLQGSSNCGQFVAGHKFTLTGHIDADGPYVLTTVTHMARSSGYRSDAGNWFNYSNQFTCMPLDPLLPFRTPRTTAKPLIPGTQTAFVVGPNQAEIFTDQYSRVKVQFHWDRDGLDNADSSCWIRVATPWAGNQWGMVHVPRVGQEVVVAFEEGDPDKPIIVGSVYNYTNMPPYALPDNQTQSGLKTRSSRGGGAANFNELRFEDKKDAEHIYFHAEKDFRRVVENNDALKVFHNQTIEITNDRTETVKEGNETITIEKGNRTETVKTGDETITIEKGNRTVSVDTGNDTHLIKQGNRDAQIDMGNDGLAIKQGNRNVQLDMGGDTLTIKMGDQTTKLDLGKSTTEAMQSIELKVGQSSIKLDQTGITIKGMMVSIEGQLQAELKGLMTTVKGDAMLMAKGGLTMIN